MMNISDLTTKHKKLLFLSWIFYSVSQNIISFDSLTKHSRYTCTWVGSPKLYLFFFDIIISSLILAILQSFSVFDENGDGKISKRELARAYRVAGFNPTNQEVEQLIKEHDVNGKHCSIFISTLFILLYL